MLNSAALETAGLRGVPVKRDHKGRALLIEMPKRVEAMEQAAPLLFSALRRITVLQLKQLQPTGEYRALIEALIVVRQIMGGEGSC